MLTRALTLLTRISFAVAVIMLVISVVLAVRHVQFERSSVTAPGTVVEMVVTGESCPNGTGSCVASAAPRITFTPSNGSPTTFLSKRSSGPPEYVVGDPVIVRYLAAEPTHARIDSVAALTPVLVVGGIGLIFLAFGLLWFAVGRSSSTALVHSTPGVPPVHDGPPEDLR